MKYLSTIDTNLGKVTYMLLMLDFDAIGTAWEKRLGTLDLRNMFTELEKELKDNPEGGFFMG